MPPTPAVTTWAGTRPRRRVRNQPASPDFVGELHYIDRQVAGIPYVNLYVCFFNSALILAHARHAPFVGLREPDADAIYLRPV
jgi:hypothetical protein